MADGFTDLLGTLGRGALTGLGVLSTIRRGGDPLAIFDERALRAQQLAESKQRQLFAEQAGLLARAQGLQDPATRQFLQLNPEAARTFGLPTETMAAASANFPLGPMPGAVPPEQALAGARTLGVLPPQVTTLPGLRQQELASRIQLQDFVQNLLLGRGGAGAGALPGGGSVAAPGGFGPSNFALTGFTAGPSGLSPTFGPAVTGTQTVEAGTVGPGGQLIQPGQTLPGRKIAVVKPSKADQSTKGQLSRINAALAAFNQFTDPVDPITGKPNPQGVRPIDTLPSGQSLGGLTGVAQALLPPQLFGIPTRIAAARGSAPAAALVTGSGQRANLVKAFGDAGNLNQQEQEAAEKSLLPGAGDTRELAAFKAEFTPRLLRTIAEGIKSGQITTPEQIRDAMVSGVVQAEQGARQQGIPAAGASVAPPGVPPRQIGPAQSPIRDMAEINRRREALGLGPQPER